MVSEIGVRAQLSASVVGGICPIGWRASRVAGVVSVDTGINGVELVGFDWSDRAIEDACPGGSFVVVRSDRAISDTHSYDRVRVGSIRTILFASLSTIHSEVTIWALSHAPPALTVCKSCQITNLWTVIDTAFGCIVSIEIRRRWAFIHT